jgi:hypothetical protein
MTDQSVPNDGTEPQQDPDDPVGELRDAALAAVGALAALAGAAERVLRDPATTRIARDLFGTVAAGLRPPGSSGPIHDADGRDDDPSAGKRPHRADGPDDGLERIDVG